MKITIYTTPTCVYCRAAKDYFKTHNYKYTEKDVSSDQSLVQEMVAKSGQLGVPVIEVNDQIVVGFDQPRLATLLSKA